MALGGTVLSEIVLGGIVLVGIVLGEIVLGGIVLGGIVLVGIVLDGKSNPPIYSRPPVYLFRGNVQTPRLFQPPPIFRT